MTEEKKGFSFFKFLLTLCILGGLVGGGLWAYQQDWTKDNWMDIIKGKVSEVKKYLPKTKKVESVVKAEVQLPKSAPSIEQEEAKAPNKTPDTSKTENTLAQQEEEENAEQEIIEENMEISADIAPDKLPPMAMDNVMTDSENVIEGDSISPDTMDSITADETTETIQEVSQEKVSVEKPATDLKAQEKVLEETAPKTQGKENFTEPQKIPAKEMDKNLYTWKNFVAGEKCNNAKLPDLNEAIKKKVLSYCQHPSGDAWYLWLNDFREAKKRFFVQEILKENSKYFKYLKTIPYLLFDVQKTKSEGSSLHDQFDKIESAIANKQTEEAINFIKQLSNSEAKKALNSILLEGQNLLEIQDAFENK